MAALLLLFTLGGNQEHVNDHFDMLEVNHFHNEYGGEAFVQLIYWDWCRVDQRFHAQGWRMMKDAFDATDSDHRRDYEARLDRWLSHISNPATRSHLRRQLKYRGKFVGGALYPKRCHRSGMYVVRFRDHNGVVRVITSDLFRETYTSVDPEVEDRKRLPETARRGLTQVPERVAQAR